MLEDTVYLLSDGGSDFLLGYMMWSMPSAGTAVSYTGKFTDLYSASTGESFTISDYQKFFTASLELPLVSRSLGSTTLISQTGSNSSDTATSTVNTTFTNGFSVYSTVSHSNSFSLGDVSSSLSTGATGTSTGQTTRFTAMDFAMRISRRRRASGVGRQPV
jgi:hypothetical protein